MMKRLVAICPTRKHSKKGAATRTQKKRAARRAVESGLVPGDAFEVLAVLGCKVHHVQCLWCIRKAPSIDTSSFFAF